MSFPPSAAPARLQITNALSTICLFIHGTSCCAPWACTPLASATHAQQRIISFPRLYFWSSISCSCTDPPAFLPAFLLCRSGLHARPQFSFLAIPCLSFDSLPPGRFMIASCFMQL